MASLAIEQQQWCWRSLIYAVVLWFLDEMCRSQLIALFLTAVKGQLASHGAQRRLFCEFSSPLFSFGDCGCLELKRATARRRRREGQRGAV